MTFRGELAQHVVYKLRVCKGICSMLNGKIWSIKAKRRMYEGVIVPKMLYGAKTDGLQE